MTGAHDTPPAWLLDRARDTARELRDAGEPVTPDAVADRMPLTMYDMQAVVLRTFRYAAAQVVADDGA